MVRPAGNALVAALALLITVIVLALLLWLALWLALIFAAILAIAALNVLLLPRVARRLGVSTGTIRVVLLPPLVAAGWLVARHPAGALAGLAVWLVALGLPGLAVAPASRRGGWNVEFRVGSRTSPRPKISPPRDGPRDGGDQERGTR